jgi:uncharacterized protein (DUF1810 family)
MNKKTKIFILFTIILLFSLCMHLCSCKKHDSDSGFGNATRNHEVESHPQQSYRLERFLDAQTPQVLQCVENELKAGRKTSHWIWFIFPQIDGLIPNPSAYTKRFSIKSFDEATEYLKHITLRERLVKFSSLVNSHAGKIPLIDVFYISGQIDVQKFISSMTLFLVAAYENQDKEAGQIFASNFQDFNQNPDINTLNILGVSESKFKAIMQWALS